MKAKQYTLQYLEAEDKHKEFNTILSLFHSEISEQKALKKVTQTSGMISIIRELNSKFKAFVSKANDKAKRGERLSNSAFIVMLKDHEPELYKNYHQNQQNGLRSTHVKEGANIISGNTKEFKSGKNKAGKAGTFDKRGGGKDQRFAKSNQKAKH